MLANIATGSIAVVCDIGMGVIPTTFIALLVVAVTAVVTYPMVMTIVVGNEMDAVARVIALAIFTKRIFSTKTVFTY